MAGIVLTALHTVTFLTSQRPCEKVTVALLSPYFTDKETIAKRSEVISPNPHKHETWILTQADRSQNPWWLLCYFWVSLFRFLLLYLGKLSTRGGTRTWPVSHSKSVAKLGSETAVHPPGAPTLSNSRLREGEGPRTEKGLWDRSALPRLRDKRERNGA